MNIVNIISFLCGLFGVFAFFFDHSDLKITLAFCLAKAATPRGSIPIRTTWPSPSPK